MKSPCCLCLCIPPHILVFYAVCVASKESKQLVLHRTSCVCYEIMLLSVGVFVCPPSFFEAYEASEIVLLSVCSLIIARQWAICVSVCPP
jgi:hypothetical protein